MVTAEEFEEQYTPKAVIRHAMQSDDAYTEQLANKAREICKLFHGDTTEMKFRLLDSLVSLLHMFAGECRGQRMSGVANPKVWGSQQAWLSQAREGIYQILTERKTLKQEFRMLALQLFDLLLVLFGPGWACTPDGKFAQLLVTSCQIELEVSVESLVYEAEKAAEEAAGSAEGPPKPEAGPTAAPQGPPEGNAEPQSNPAARTATLTCVCSVLQNAVTFLTAEDDAGQEAGWAALPPEAITTMYNSLVAAYSNLLNYFIAREGVVREDADIVCVGLLEDLMQDMDEGLHHEEAETVREMLQKSGYYEGEG